MSARTRWIGASLPLLVTLSIWGSSQNTAVDGTASSIDEPFSTAPSEPNHEEITAAGLSFLRPDIVVVLQEANAATDVEPPSVAMTHADLNKDKSTLPGRLQQYEAAKALATQQTTHEWCRLRALARAKWGDAGVARLDAFLAPGATPPACE